MLKLSTNELNEMLQEEGFDMTSEELAYQLTAYEKGYIDYDDGIMDLVVHEYLQDMSIDELVSRFNEYCQEVGYYDNMIYDFTENFFEDNFSSAYEASRATYFGKISNWTDEYIKFNGYGNLESMSSWVARDEILEDSDFMEWAFTSFDEFSLFNDDEFKESIISMTCDLVKQGY